MKQWKLIGWMTGIPVLVIVLILIIVFHEPERDGITRAMAAKSVALAVKSQEELEAWQQEYGASFYSAKELQQWYVPYMDYLYAQGYLKEQDTPANEQTAMDQLTYGEAYQIAYQFSPDLTDSVRLTTKNVDKPYPEEFWWRLYDSLLKETDSEDRARLTSVLVYGTAANLDNTPEWTAYTNLGKVTFHGLAMDAYIDHELEAYVRGDEIIHILNDKGSEVVYKNVWITDGDEDSLQLFIGDIEREISFQKKSKKTDEVIYNMADIYMKEGEISKVSVKKERITAKVLSVGETGIELEGYGLVPLDEEYKIIKIYGDLQRQQLKDILVGYDMQEFVVAGGKICAALTVRPFEADKIRVLIMTEGFQAACHDTVTISCEGGMNIWQGDQQRELGAGEELCLNRGDDSLRDGRLIIEPAAGYELALSSIKRSDRIPYYGGRLECIDTDQGIAVINELYLEDYLKKVVPSEMPSDYEKEALKAQAICARTYAYIQMQGNNYSQYGAHLDDSINFQVYNNVETDVRTEAAVQETYGKLLLYEGVPVPTYFYSTSCGTTTDTAIWGSDPEKTPYLKSVGLQPGRKNLNLTSEEAFSSFIKNQDYPSYDSGYALYRWRVTTTSSILTENIGGVGTVQNIKITERGAGGVAQTMLVTGTEGEKTINRQDNIRSALGDKRLTLIQKNDNESKQTWSSLPSGFLTIENQGTNDAGEQIFCIYGGGYGHGVGMSQNGAQGMAKAGMSCEEILKFFYDGVTIEELAAQDPG
ncbi:MAG: SpoIID/LytB domain-containing protein [Lachnospiraceae bacterium]